MSVGDKGIHADMLNRTYEIGQDPILLFHNRPNQRVSHMLKTEYCRDCEIESLERRRGIPELSDCFE